MKPEMILYVDDEAMALKYFERLVSPLAPVLTASSVAEGREVLAARGHEIAVLVSDQRMPTAYGNELLSYARSHHPGIVRMLTTAYSELGEAIEAINTGEIYRYITKPWDLESLRADLKNAIELAGLRFERDSLLREKMMIQQQQLLAGRVSQLAMLAAVAAGAQAHRGVKTYLDAAALVQCKAPSVDWHKMDHADLMQSESMAGIALAEAIQGLKQSFSAAGQGQTALQALAGALPQVARWEGDRLVVTERQVFCAVLESAAGQAPSPASVAWLAWLLWSGTAVKVVQAGEHWQVQVDATAPQVLASDWLADAVERVCEAAT